MEHRGGAFPANGTTWSSGSAFAVLIGSVRMATVLASLNLRGTMYTQWWAKLECLHATYVLCEGLPPSQRLAWPTTANSCISLIAARASSFTSRGLLSRD